MPSAAASGTSECDGANAGPDFAAVREDVDDEVGERGTGEQAQRAGEQRHEQRFAGDQPADLRRGRAEGAQHRGLPAALGDRECERPGDDEQRDRAGDAAERAEDRDQPGAIRGGRIPGIGIGGVPAIEHVEPVPEALSSGGLCSAAADVPGSAITPTAFTCPGAPDKCGGDVGGEEHARPGSDRRARVRRRGRSRGSARRRSG